MRIPQILRIKVLLLASVASLIFAENVSAEPEPVKSANLSRDNETAAERDARMKWWREARFGMFIHWGLYSVAGGEWEGKKTGDLASWMQSHLNVPTKDYGALRSKFTAKNYDPAVWAKLAKSAGMKYAVLTAKHHEGFCLFDSKHTDYDIMTTPAKRDLLKGYFKAFRAEGLKTGLYYSLFDWNHSDYRVKGDPFHPMRDNPEFIKQDRDIAEYQEYMQKQTRELATNYGKLDIMWWDYSFQHMAGEYWGAKKLNHLLYSLQPDIITNNRLYDGQRNTQGDFCTPEQHVPARGLGYDWETCMTMNETWGYKPDAHNYKSSQKLIRTLIQTSARGGNFLLNVGPKPDGTIPQEQIQRLKDIGKWMALHSESIHGTQASPFTKNFSWGYCTQKALADGNTRLYFQVLNRPEGNMLAIKQLGNKVISAHYLSDPSKPELKHSKLKRGISIALPTSAANPNAEVIAVDIKGKPEMSKILTFADDQGVYHLEGGTANIQGITLHYPTQQQSIGGWINIKEWVSWTFKTSKARRYRVTVNYGLAEGSGGTVEIKCGDQNLTFETKPTGGWFKRQSSMVGKITLPANTLLTMEVRTLKKKGAAALDLKGIKLTPVSE